MCENGGQPISRNASGPRVGPDSGGVAFALKERDVYMQLIPGKLVVHPHHGPATVTNTFQRTVKGAEVTYIELTIRSNNLVVSIPDAKFDEIGVREVYDRAHLRKLLEVVQEPTGVEEKQWSRRMKANQEKVASGSCISSGASQRNSSKVV